MYELYWGQEIFLLKLFNFLIIAAGISTGTCFFLKSLYIFFVFYQGRYERLVIRRTLYELFHLVKIQSYHIFFPWQCIFISFQSPSLCLHETWPKLGILSINYNIRYFKMVAFCVSAIIADMSLDILEHVKGLNIKHLPETKLAVRIGNHTGSCCAGTMTSE